MLLGQRKYVIHLLHAIVVCYHLSRFTRIAEMSNHSGCDDDDD